MRKSCLLCPILLQLPDWCSSINIYPNLMLTLIASFRVILFRLSSVLADCREAAAEAVGHLNLGIFAALAEYWERGTLKESFKRMKKTSNSMKFRWILRSKSQSDKVHHFLTMFWLDFSGSRPVQALNALEAETFGLWRNRIWLTLSLNSQDGICKYWIIEYL